MRKKRLGRERKKQMGRQGYVKGKVTGAEEKRATGKRGRWKKRVRQALGGRWWVQRDRRSGVEGC